MPKPNPRAAVDRSAPQLSVVIVNYNSGGFLAQCLEAVLDSAVPLQVLIGDNGSSDGSLGAARKRCGGDPRVTMIENGANLGFAAANNRILPLARAPYILFVNPDCIVKPAALERLIAFMEETEAAGMAGCIVRNPDGSEQAASRRAIPDPLSGLLGVSHLDRVWPFSNLGTHLYLTDSPIPARPLPVDAIAGCFMLVRRAALDAVGPLDEGYFLHCEDLDWFVRFARAGWRIYLVPDVSVIHHKGACSAHRPARVEWHKHRGMARFFRKFQFRDSAFPLSFLVLAGIWLHFFAVVLAIAVRRAIHSLGRRTPT